MRKSVLIVILGIVGMCAWSVAFSPATATAGFGCHGPTLAKGCAGQVPMVADCSATYVGYHSILVPRRQIRIERRLHRQQRRIERRAHRRALRWACGCSGVTIAATSCAGPEPVE